MTLRRRYTRIGYFGGCLLLWICVCSPLAGCGRSLHQGMEPTESEEPASKPYYQITEYEIPDADEALRRDGVLQDEAWWCKEVSRFFQDGKLYRFVNVKETEKTQQEVFWNRSNYVQILEEPYTDWNSVKIETEFPEDDQLLIDSVVACGDNRFLLSMSILGRNESCLLDYVVGEKTKKAEDSDKLLKPSEALLGFVQNPLNQEKIWYGSGEKGVTFFDASGEKQIGPELELVDHIFFQVACSEEGNLFVADKSSLCLMRDKMWEKVLSFAEKDYVPDTMEGLWVFPDGRIAMYVSEEAEEYILIAEEMDRSLIPEKQEIVIAIGSLDRGLQRVITAYNRHNDRIHVTVQTRPDKEDYEDYRNRIQMEISAGKGPDLVSDNLIQVRAYVQNGYLKSLDGVIANEEDFVESALQAGRYDGVTYGIPYYCSVQLAVFPKDLVQDKEFWTPEEMMNAVKQSNAQVLMKNLGAGEIIYYCGLLDKENNDYIDWENRKSHLKEEPFLKLVKFAKAYSDKNQFSWEEVAERKIQGDIAGEYLSLYRAGQMDYGDACFGKRGTAYVGFPGKKGPGIYMRTYCLCMNQASEKDEAVHDFLQYLLSEKAQKLYLDNSKTYAVSMLSVRWDAIDCGIKEYSEIAKNPIQCMVGGISFLEDGLNEEQEKLYRKMIRQAKAYDWETEQVMDMVREELEPYFEGSKAAEQCVEILDNRVQLYLNE